MCSAKPVLLSLVVAALSACGAEPLPGFEVHAVPRTRVVPLMFSDAHGSTTTSIKLVQLDGSEYLALDEAFTRRGEVITIDPVEVEVGPLHAVVATTTFGNASRFDVVVDEPSPDAEDPVFLLTYARSGGDFIVRSSWRTRSTLGVRFSF